MRAEKLRGAGVDVFTHEPMRPDHPLRGLANAVLTPHVAYKTPGAQRRMLISPAMLIAITTSTSSCTASFEQPA